MQMALAYKYVMTMAMIAFVNHYAPRLNLPIEVPLKDHDIKKLGCEPPECETNKMLYGGGIQAGKYSFSFEDGFNHSPYLHFTGYFVITKLEDDGLESFGIPLLHPKESAKSVMERASLMKYSVYTNDLYQIATNYMIALEMDQKVFEKENSLTTDPPAFNSVRGWVPSPVICAYFGKRELRDPGSNGFAFLISSVTGELLEMNVGNSSTCKGLPLIKNLDKLAAIPDGEFLKYSSLERSNLLVLFAGLHCTNMYCPGVDGRVRSQAPAISETLQTNAISESIPASGSSAK
jgi:hypothetical protein